MRKLFFLSLFAAFFMTACAQDDKANTEIPSVVLNAFETKFDNSTDSDWEMEAQDYEVEFDLQNVEHTALFNGNGELLKYKKEITEADLPNAVKTALQNEFSDKKFDDFELLIIDGVEYYQMEIEETLRDKDVIFTASGEMTSEISIWD